MEDIPMSLNTKLEVALEILASKIAKMSNKGYTVEDKEMQLLIDERKKMYAGDQKIIEKIITVYGPEINNEYTKELLDNER